MKELQTRWDLRITKADNGYRCNWLQETDDLGDVRIYENVTEEAESEHREVEAFARLLWFITDFFGMVGSKHDERRINITTGGENENLG